ncbi:MAG: hypothetical protein DRG59_11355 [Deltaproteobacteria bacterium]|nr:MAG: hypothetical protein DRG59_11355 [Deltaproteobacteria bacterium]
MMLFALLASNEKAALSDLADTLTKNDVSTEWTESGDKALFILDAKKFDLVVIDEKLSDMTGLDFAKKLIAVNPLINCALVSSLSPEDFHNASEGLGIVMQLPPLPNKEDTEKLLEHLSRILNMSSRKTP